MTPNWLFQNRIALWRLGVEHREALLAQYMVFYGLTERPPLKSIYRELLSEIQGARLIYAPLPMDRYAQTEVVNGRTEITINTLIGRMPGIKDHHGVEHVAGWHESFHVAVDVERRDLPPLTYLTRGLGGSTSSPLLCDANQNDQRGWTVRERAIETAALAAAIADADLRRTLSYLNFLQLASWGGDMGAPGWQFLESIAGRIGVNRTALRRYLEQHGICRFSAVDGKNRLIGISQPFRGFVCLEPESALTKSIALQTPSATRS